ncbi:MAG: sigma-70 family RNA polymerase sigma factor [Lentisphaeria bacterium]|nr:sigma-70 family RNA polymerase sigma factor [Lentisphaeria bacterium]
MSILGTRNMADLATGELILRVRAGRIEFYEELVRRYQPEVLRVINTMLYNRSATEELAQQVFVNAYLHLDGFDENRDFGPWIRTIARNAVREHLRTTSRYAHRLQAYADTLNVRFADNDHATDYEDGLRERLAVCLEKLPERSGVVIQMRYHQGWSFAQIAASLGTPEGALRNLLCRTRAKLRQCMERGGGSE